MGSRKNENKVEARGRGTGDRNGDTQGDVKSTFCRNQRRKFRRHRENYIAGNAAKKKALGRG